MNQNFYNSNSLGFDQTQPPQSPVIHQPPQEISIQEMEDLKQQYFDEMKRLINSEYRDEIKIYKLKGNFNITPSLSTEKPENSLNMGDEHLDTIPEIDSDEEIESSVKNLNLTPSESEDLFDYVREYDLPFCDNSPNFNNDYEIFYYPLFDSKDDYTSSDDESSSEEDVLVLEDLDLIPLGNDNDHFNVESDLIESLLNKDTMITSPKIDFILEEFAGEPALINPIPPGIAESKFDSKVNIRLIKKLLYDNSSPRSSEELNSENDFEKENSGSPTTHSNSSLYASFLFDFSINPFPPANRSDFYVFTDELIPFISPPEYDCFLFKVEPNSRDYTKDVVEDISPTKEPQVHNALPTHPNLQLNMKFQPSNEYLFTYVVWIFLPFLEFADELAHIISPSEYDCFYFGNLPYPGEWISSLNFGIHENLSSTTRVNLPVEDDHSPLLAYVVWIFLAYLTYPVIPPHLHSFINEDTIFNPGITINHLNCGVLPEADHCQPPQYTVNHPIFNVHNDLLNSQNELMEQMESLTSIDDDDDYNSAITPNEPIESLSMGDEHLNTISATESDKFIKSCVENLVPNPKIIPMKIDQHHFNVESDLIESMRNHDSSIIPSSSKIDSLLDEFAGKLTLLKSILPRIDKTDCHPENEIRLIERLLYDNSSPPLPKEFVFENSNAEIESFSPSPIPVKYSDSFMEEIDLSCTPDDPMPPGIEDDDYDSERDILIREELLNNYSLSLPVIESYHFDIPSFSRPPVKPPDGNIAILNIKMIDDNSEQNIPGNVKTLAKGFYPQSSFPQHQLGIIYPNLID
nr:hypothetical protein [Tanacetum cinerariifolium]